MDPTIDKKVVIKLPDNITTDHIATAGAKVLPYRSNIEKLSTFVFENINLISMKYAKKIMVESL